MYLELAQSSPKIFKDLVLPGSSEQLHPHTNVKKIESREEQCLSLGDYAQPSDPRRFQVNHLHLMTRKVLIKLLLLKPRKAPLSQPHSLKLLLLQRNPKLCLKFSKLLLQFLVMLGQYINILAALLLPMNSKCSSTTAIIPSHSAKTTC